MQLFGWVSKYFWQYILCPQIIPTIQSMRQTQIQKAGLLSQFMSKKYANVDFHVINNKRFPSCF